MPNENHLLWIKTSLDCFHPYLRFTSHVYAITVLSNKTAFLKNYEVT